MSDDSAQSSVKGFLRVRVNQLDTQHEGGLLSEAGLARMMTDCGNEIGIRLGTGSTLLAAYEDFEFFEPVFAGDYLEIHARLLAIGHRSRRIAVEAHRVIRAVREPGGLVDGIVLEPPELVASGTIVSVVAAHKAPATTPRV